MTTGQALNLNSFSFSSFFKNFERTFQGAKKTEMSSNGDHKKIGVFWDYENVNINSRKMDVRATIDKIQSSITELHPGIFVSKTLYYDPKKQDSQRISEVEFHSAGYGLCDCPTRGKKEFVDKKILVDLMKFLYDHGNNTIIVLISSDGDFDYCLSILRDYGVKIVVIQNGGTHVLYHCCDSIILWQTLVVLTPSPPPRPLPMSSGSSSSSDGDRYQIQGKGKRSRSDQVIDLSLESGDD